MLAFCSCNEFLVAATVYGARFGPGMHAMLNAYPEEI
jgi:hypothetical protein